MEDKAPGITDYLLLWGGIVLSWLAGEGGRVVVASGLGGLVRWISTDRRRIQDGIIAVLGGGICGSYLWPVVLYIPTIPPISSQPIPETPDNIAMAAFVMGTMGISFVKIGAALVRTWAERAKHHSPGDADG